MGFKWSNVRHALYSLLLESSTLSMHYSLKRCKKGHLKHFIIAIEAQISRNILNGSKGRDLAAIMINALILLIFSPPTCTRCPFRYRHCGKRKNHAEEQSPRGNQWDKIGIGLDDPRRKNPLCRWALNITRPL